MIILKKRFFMCCFLWVGLLYPNKLKKLISGFISMALLLGKTSSKRICYSRRFCLKVTSYLLVIISTSLTCLGGQVASATPHVDQAIHLLHQGNMQEGENLLLTEANKGNPEACFYLSQAKLHGQKPDIKAGMKLLQKAVSSGFSPAMDTLAGYYLHGDFIEQDHHKALMYYQLAANRGYGPSQFNCGIMLKNGEKTPKDLEEAFVYLALAALNRKDLDDLTEDAAMYRDEVARKLTPEAYQRAMIKMNKLVKKN